MRDDEFTNSKSNNESFIAKSEYGNVQDSEFSDSGEMHLHKAAYDASLMKQQSNGSTESPSVEISSAGGASGATGAASSSGTVVSSTVSATSAAAATTGVIVIASSVAVASLGVLTGISVALHDYDFKINSFIISSNQLNYNLTIIDKEMSDDDLEHYYDQQDMEEGKEKMPFVIRIFNNNYDSSQELFYFEQSGVFTNLNLGDKYNLVVSENRFGGQIIYEDTFITYVNSAFMDFEFYGLSNFEDGTFQVYMDFVDEKDVLDNFTISLYYPDAPEKTVASFELEEVSGTQNVSFLNENQQPVIDLTEEYGYTFSYTNDGSPVEYRSGTVSFFDMYGRSTQFNKFIYDKTVNFLDSTMEVTIDYIDYFNWYDNFVLTLTAHYGLDEQGNATTADTWEEDREISLIATNQPQTINLMEQDINYEDALFTYVLTADYRGTNIELDREDTPFKVTDNSGAVSEFYGLEFNKTMSWKDYTMTFRLDYVDEFGYYDNFIVHMTQIYDAGEQTYTDNFDIPLDSTDETQIIDVSEYEPIVYEVDENYLYQYYLTADYRGYETTLVELTAPFELHDDGNSESRWNSFIFDKTANFLTNSFEVRLDYVDDFFYYTNFVLTLLPYGVNAEYNFSLSETTDTQTCTFDGQEHWNYSFDYDYGYRLTCDYRGVETTLVEGDTEFKFTDNSGFHALIFDQTYDYGNNTFDLRLDYDTSSSDFSNFVFYLYDGVYTDTVWAEIPLEATNETQTIDMEEYEIGAEQDFVYSLSCSYRGNTIELVRDNTPFTFHDPATIPSASLTFINNEFNYATGEMWVQLDINDKYGFISEIYMTLYGKNHEDDNDYSSEYEEYLEITEEPQMIRIPRNFEETGIDYAHYNVGYGLTWRYTTTEDEDYGSLSYQPIPITLSNSAITEFRDAESSFEIYKETVNPDTEDEYEQYVMWINFDYIDENGCYSDMHPCFQPVENQGYLVVADLYYSTDGVPSGWYKYIVGPNSGEVFENGEGICDGQEWLLVVEGWNDTDPYDEYEESNMSRIYTEICTPTYVDSPTPQVYGVDIDTQIMGGDGYFNISPLFAGSSTDFTNMQLILEDDSNNVYKYSISVLSPYMGIDLADDDDSSVSDVYDCFNSDHTFTITFKFAYASEPNNIITMVLGENVQFVVSVQQ